MFRKYLITGLLIWAGLEIAQQLGFGPFNYAVSAAVLLGILQLIPELGFFLGFFPILLAFAIGGPVSGVVALVVYVGAVKGASTLVEPRISRGVLDVHPGLLIPAIVVLSQFGVIWLLAAAPAVAIVRDLVRYANARLAEPPGPAGVLARLAYVPNGQSRLAMVSDKAWKAAATASAAAADSAMRCRASSRVRPPGNSWLTPTSSIVMSSASRLKESTGTLTAPNLSFGSIS